MPGSWVCAAGVLSLPPEHIHATPLALTKVTHPKSSSATVCAHQYATVDALRTADSLQRDQCSSRRCDDPTRRRLPAQSTDHCQDSARQRRRSSMKASGDALTWLLSWRILILAVLDRASQTAQRVHIGGAYPSASHGVLPGVDVVGVLICSQPPTHQRTYLAAVQAFHLLTCWEDAEGGMSTQAQHQSCGHDKMNASTQGVRAGAAHMFTFRQQPPCPQAIKDPEAINDAQPPLSSAHSAKLSPKCRTIGSTCCRDC